jgi:hypothetical protein
MVWQGGTICKNRVAGSLVSSTIISSTKYINVILVSSHKRRRENFVYFYERGYKWQENGRY